MKVRGHCYRCDKPITDRQSGAWVTKHNEKGETVPKMIHRLCRVGWSDYPGGPIIQDAYAR